MGAAAVTSPIEVLAIMECVVIGTMSSREKHRGSKGRESKALERTKPRERRVERPTEGKTQTVAGREGSGGRGGQADKPRNPKTGGADEPRKAVQGERGIESE